MAYVNNCDIDSIDDVDPGVFKFIVNCLADYEGLK